MIVVIKYIYFENLKRMNFFNFINKKGEFSMEYIKDYFKGKPLRNYFEDWTFWEKGWISISTIIILITCILTWDSSNAFASSLSLISSITGIWCVILTAKKRISNYLIGFVNIITYAAAAYMWKLYGDFILNAFYFMPMQFIGLYLWNKPNMKVGKDEIKAMYLSKKNLSIYLILTIIGIGLYGILLNYFGGNSPYLDSTSTILSIVAMIFMVKGFPQQWLLWIIVDIVSSVMWLNIVINHGGLMNLGLAIMWITWTINAIYGWYKWKK
jgi:nicotinamide mononucleotide transporter